MTLASITYFYYLCLLIEGGNSLHLLTIVASCAYNAVGAKIFDGLNIRMRNVTFIEKGW